MWMSIHTHTHTHTHIYIYIYIRMKCLWCNGYLRCKWTNPGLSSLLICIQLFSPQLWINSRCHTISPLCWVWACAPVRRYLCLFWCETQTKGLSSISPTRLEVDEETKVPERTEGQLAMEDGEPVDNSQQKEAGEDGSMTEKGVNRSQKGDC